MNKQIAIEELLEVLKHLRQDEMRIERIAKCLKLDLEQERINDLLKDASSTEDTKDGGKTK